VEIYGRKEGDKEKMKLEKFSATLPNSEEVSEENYEFLTDMLKLVGKYRNWMKKCRIHYRREFKENIKDNIINYFIKNEKQAA